jgi:hypothetical protein
LTGPAHGAQRASSARFRRPRRAAPRSLVLALAATAVLATLGASVAGATTSSVGPNASVALTTTTIDRPWYSVERYYLGLLNCSRTGGWVQSNGTCVGYGSGHYSAYVPPISYNFGLSDKVTRPYAKLLAVKGQCSHTMDGDPGNRLSRVGYTRWTWGENIGCRDGYSSAKAAVLASHLNFQAEKSANGGHWRNIKNRAYHWVGIGIWRYGTRTRLVTDFYG